MLMPEFMAEYKSKKKMAFVNPKLSAKYSN